MKALLTLSLLLLAIPVGAQTPTPVTATTGVAFTALDHFTVDVLTGTPIIARYELRFVPTIGCAPVPPADLGKPTIGAVTDVILVKPIAAFATLPPNCVYTATVAAIGPTGAEGVSAPTDPFVRVVLKTPAPPGKPALRP